MRASTGCHALLLIAIAHLACLPAGYGSGARFSPPAIVLEPDAPVRSYLIRLCGTESAGEEATTARIGVSASSTTPVRATMLVEHGDNEPVEITAAAALAEGVSSAALWFDHDVPETCEIGVVVTFALLEPVVEADGPAKLDWLVSASVHSFAQEDAEHLSIELYVEELD